MSTHVEGLKVYCTRRLVRVLTWIAMAAVLGSGFTSGLPAAAQQSAVTRPADAGPRLALATPEALVEAFVDAVRKDDESALAKLFGPDFRKFAPRPENSAELREKFLDAYATQHKIVLDRDKATLEAGKDGWTMPVPMVKGAKGWSFDIAAGSETLRLRAIGRNELATIQALLAIVDAQQEYAIMDPMKTGTTQYARRLLSLPGQKDGLYWEQKPGDPESPLGDMLAKAQDGSIFQGDGYFGYRYRLLYAQGPHAKGGARQYIVGNRMVAGFAAIASPVRYGEAGVMTFIVNQDGIVFEKDLGPNSWRAAIDIQSFDPDDSWAKSDTTP